VNGNENKKETGKDKLIPVSLVSLKQIGSF
jgi:hypothetical protein